jgi:hypothetical protein
MYFVQPALLETSRREHFFGGGPIPGAVDHSGRSDDSGA